MLDIQVDTREFNKAWREYQTFNKRALPTIVNMKTYFIARNAVNTTPAVDKAIIEAQLRSVSSRHSPAPLGAILINKMRGSKGEKGLFGKRMASELNKFIRIRNRSINFLRSGWISAIKAIEPFIEKKSGPPYKKSKILGQHKGGAKAAVKSMTNWMCKASIWNSVVGGKKNHGLDKKNDYNKVKKILTLGLQLAINKEVASMKQYVEKKLKEGADKFNRT